MTMAGVQEGVGGWVEFWTSVYCPVPSGSPWASFGASFGVELGQQAVWVEEQGVDLALAVNLEAGAVPTPTAVVD